jgi:hypothetical protein
MAAGIYNVLSMSSIADNNNNTIQAMEISPDCNTIESRPPPLISANDDGEDSSMDSSGRSDAQGTKKQVSWDRIQTREYALVVGDHPFCQDGLPMSLDWQYSERTAACLRLQQAHQEVAAIVSERQKSYQFPKRLSYEQRRDRLCSVSGLTTEQIKNDEIELVVRTLKESWEQIADALVCGDGDPLETQDMMIWDEVPGLDCDLADVSDFEWTESL